MMASPDWARVAELLDAVLDLDPEARAAYLDDACGEDDALRAEVEAALSAEDAADAYLGDGFASFAGTDLLHAVADALDVPPAPEPAPAGTRIGAYRLTDVLGRGGMGTVYRAERADGTFRQTVAVKLMHRELGPQALDRFRAERQILADLDHPNIARLLDGGVTEDGRPFLVMEHVDGRPLIEDGNARRLPVEERLRRFVQVAEAVQYVHRNLVIHRDLKPTNVLVTPDGTVKLLDFGIAKVLDAAVGTQVDTRTGQAVLTPAYAAPEQLQGEAITTATDVYGLGVLLYEGLTGCHPFASARHTPAAYIEALERTSPRPASEAARAAYETVDAPDERARQRGTTPDRLGATLAGDLDTIVGTALERAPERRYATVDALRADLQRYLERRPIAAAPPSASYRARRFVQRNRGAVAAAGSVLLALVVGLSLALWQANVAAQERDRARAAAQRAEQTSAFLQQMFLPDSTLFPSLQHWPWAMRTRDAEDPPPVTVAAGPSPGASETILRTGRHRILTALDGQPALQGHLLTTIGTLHRQRGHYATADTLLQQALALVRSAPDADSASVARTLHHLARAKDLRGAYADAERLHRAALDRWMALDTPPLPEVGRSQDQLASLLAYTGAYAEADSLYQEALRTLQAAKSNEDPEVSGVLHNLAWLHREQGMLDEAVTLYQEALHVGGRHLPADHPEMLTTVNGLAVARKQQGRLAEADSLYRRVLDARTRILGPDHPRVGNVHSNLGFLLRERGNLDEAADHLQTALRIWRAALGDAHPNVAVGLSNLGQVEHDRGRHAAAETHLRAAVALNRKVLPEGHPRTASALMGLGQVLMDTGRAPEAVPVLREAVTIRRARYTDDSRARLQAEHALGEALRAIGEVEEAEQILTSALQTARASYPSDHSLVNQLRAAMNER